MPKSISEWIKDRPRHGWFTFSHNDVVEAFPEMTPGAMSRALTREVNKGCIMSPLRGFYVIITDEYALRGTVPQAVYLDQMMQHLERNYYVALLNAAEYYGAAHQAPMSFSVMIEPPSMRNKKTDKYHTLYFCKSHIPEAYVERRQTLTGYINLSGPELTAVDLLTYQDKIGGVTRAATVLAELAEKLDFSRLDELFVKSVPVTSLQRLGYILDVVLEEHAVADSIYILLKAAGVTPQAVPLKPGKLSDGCELNVRWKVIVNQEIEIDDL
jgi:predicted transcriptional regulator of viral defense system